MTTNDHESASHPTVEEAFSVLVEESQPPVGRNTVAYRRLCRAVIEEAIDRAEILRTGRPVLWPDPHLENTNIGHRAPINTRIPTGEASLGIDTSQAEASRP
jgi:hypothetical protein